MADVQDLELESERSAVSLTQQPVRKNISLKLKPKVEGKSKKKDKKKSEKKTSSDGDKESKKRKNSGDVPSQTTKPGGEILWNQQISLIGQKVQDPLLHQCERCSLPILLYGRMSPCKHAFCLGCAEKANGKCPRCGDIVQRIEPARLGRVFVCSFGGSRYGISGCRRSYLSQRDLHAHIKRRHQSELPVGGGDLSAEYAADLKRNMAPAVVYPVAPMQMIRETLPPPPQQVQHERPFLRQPTMVAERPMQVPSIAMDVYRSRPPTVPNFPMNQGVVQRMPIPSVTTRIVNPNEHNVHMRPRFIEDLSRQPRPVGQPQAMRFPGREELRPGWIPNERDWSHGVQRGDWMPPRSEPAPIPHAIRPQEGPHFVRGAPPFY